MLRIEEIVGNVDDDFRDHLDEMATERLQALLANRKALSHLCPVGVSYREAVATAEAIIMLRAQAEQEALQPKAPPPPAPEKRTLRKRSPPAPTTTVNPPPERSTVAAAEAPAADPEPAAVPNPTPAPIVTTALLSWIPPGGLLAPPLAAPKVTEVEQPAIPEPMSEGGAPSIPSASCSPSPEPPKPAAAVTGRNRVVLLAILAAAAALVVAVLSR